MLRADLRPPRRPLGRGDRTTGAAVRHAPAAGSTHDGQVALAVGSVHPHVVGREPVERAGRRVTIGVVGTHRDEGDAGLGRGQEVRIGVRAAVVRDLQHVGLQVHPAGQDAGLRLRVQVAGEQDPDAALGHPHQEAEVVGLGLRRRDLRRRCQHLDGGTADGAGVPGQQRGPPGAGAVSECVHGADAVVGRRQRSGGDHAHAAPVQRPGEPAHVVGVQMRQQQQRDVGDAQPAQAAVLRADVRPDVDQHRRPRSGRKHEGIPLTDVAGHQVRGSEGPAAHRLAQRPAEDDQPHHGGQCDRPHPREPPQERDDHQQKQGEQDRPAGAGRPAGGAVGEVGCPVRDQHQPADRPAGEPGRGVGRRRRHRGHDGRDQPEHGGRRDRRRRQQVGGQGHQRDLARQRGDQRRGDDARRGADGDRIGDETGHPMGTQPARPARREDDDGRRRRHGEREARIRRQRRIGEQQHNHGAAERRDGRTGTSRGERHEADGSHRGCAQHAGARLGEQDEPGERDAAGQGLDAPVDRPAAQRPQHAGQDDRHVRAGDRHEMGEPRRAEILGQHRIEGAGVADDEAR